MKRDLAVNIAVLPLPTPPAGARGEGRGSAASGLPLPKGEGWGEGEEIVHQPIVHEATQPTRHPQAPSDLSSIASPIDLQFPQFLDIAARRDEPLSLSPINEQILTLTTDYRLPNV